MPAAIFVPHVGTPSHLGGAYDYDTSRSGQALDPGLGIFRGTASLHVPASHDYNYNRLVGTLAGGSQLPSREERPSVRTSAANASYTKRDRVNLLPVDDLFAQVESTPGYRLVVDLQACTVTTPAGTEYAFEVEQFRRHCLLEGLDDIGLTLQHEADIEAYEKQRAAAAPWLFARGG